MLVCLWHKLICGYCVCIAYIIVFEFHIANILVRAVAHLQNEAHELEECCTNRLSNAVVFTPPIGLQCNDSFTDLMNL